MTATDTAPPPTPKATPPPEADAIPASTQEYQGPPQAWLRQNALWRPEMTREEVRQVLAGLWVPTPPELVAKLARYAGDRNTPRDQRTRRECAECGSYHEFPCIHLDYLGHADTCRLIAQADPCWGWYPQAGFDEQGEPRVVRNREGYPIRMWIWLDILGVVRPGVGTVEVRKTDPEKELVGDAIRNSAMRFGIAADLWSKARGAEAEVDSQEGHYQARAENRAPSARQTAETGDAAPPGQAPPPTLDEWARKNGWINGEEDLTAASAAVKARLGEMVEAGKISRDQANKAWQDYNRPDPQRPNKARPRTADSHAQWWSEVIAPLTAENWVAAGHLPVDGPEPRPEPDPEPPPAQARPRRADKSDVPDNSYRDELDLLYRQTVDANEDGAEALASDLKNTTSGEVSRALAFRGADGQGAGDTIRRRLGLIVVRRAEADKAAGRWKLDETAIFAGSETPAEASSGYADDAQEEPF